jgi:hypothetical protein
MDDARAPWSGRFEFQLIDGTGKPVLRIDIVLRRDVVTIWDGDANLAMIDRDWLRAWLGSDGSPVERHDLVIAVVDTWIAFGIAGGPPLWLTPADALRLRAVL